MRLIPAACFSLTLATVLAFTVPASAAPATFDVRLSPSQPLPVSGRLIVFAQPAPASPVGGQAPDDIDFNLFAPLETAISAREIHNLRPGESVRIDADDLAFPVAFSDMPKGRYRIQALVDQDHNYAYAGRGAGDVLGPVTYVDLPGDGVLQLDHILPPAATAVMPETAAAFSFDSARLSQFWGRSVSIKGAILLPPGYTKTRGRFPTVYVTHGFSGTLDGMIPGMTYIADAMAAGDMPPMIWVFLEETNPMGTHEFADSVNNGPWGAALVDDLIPYLEKHYRMDAASSGRFLTGHSSAGWATLWLQTTYAKTFGGTWSTAPDPSDFHDFFGVDLYAPNANMYSKPDGSDYPIIRNHSDVLVTTRDAVRFEGVLGEYGDQFTSMDSVFSPKGEDGRPQPMFNHATGQVDPVVAAYWREHYDIAYRIAHDWKRLKPDLDGKIHLYVGTSDTFYLDGPARRLKATLDGLGAKSNFYFLPDRTHMDLYTIGEDSRALTKVISWDMYAVARPAAKRPEGLPALATH